MVTAPARSVAMSRWRTIWARRQPAAAGWCRAERTPVDWCAKQVGPADSLPPAALKDEVPGQADRRFVARRRGSAAVVGARDIPDTFAARTRGCSDTGALRWRDSAMRGRNPVAHATTP